MCGIVGMACQKSLVPFLLEALERLEYRGYDSSGIAVCEPSGLRRCRAVGKVADLKEQLKKESWGGAEVGIAHVRWATHGAATIENAHPQSDGQVALVHNGIIENFAELKALLPGVAFESQTDTEVMVHLISKKINQGLDFTSAVLEVIRLLRGTFAFVVLNRAKPNMLIAARKSSPLILGMGEGDLKGSIFVASDAVAISPWIDQQMDLNDEEVCVVQSSKNGYFGEFFNFSGQKIEKKWNSFKKLDVSMQKGSFQNFTMKEIRAQPLILERMIQRKKEKALQKLSDLIVQAQGVKWIGCGSSFYAGLVGKYWAEMWCGLPSEAEIASEFRYRQPVLSQGVLHMLMSQSGETIDMVEAQKHIQERGQKTFVITNVARSIMAKAADCVFDLDAGPEFGVVSTKAFTAQLAAIACLILSRLERFDPEQAQLLQADFEKVPALLTQVFERESSYEKAAKSLVQAKSVLFLGRGLEYPIAMESALKFKEISYIHAEGYPAGEMKHGPIALVDSSVPTVVLAPFDELFDKTLSNVQEIMARKGPIVLWTDAKGVEKTRLQNMDSSQIQVCVLPETGPISKVFVYSVAGQLLAYKVAQCMGRNIDHPRNLAKSVTVE